MSPGTHARGETPPPARRVSPWRLGTPLVVLVCGALFVISAQSSEGTDLRPGRYTDLASVAEAEADHYRELDQERTELQQEVEELTAAVGDRSTKRYQRQIDKLADPAGLTPREGEGVTVTLSDAPQELLESTEEDANLLVVHQQDIQAVVNALWKAGAEAVTIAGQRIITTTGIKCEGSAVQLQGVPYPQPYEISAVGVTDKLVDGLMRDSYLEVYRAQAADPDIQIGWELEPEEHVEAPAYEGVTDFEYAQVLDGD